MEEHFLKGLVEGEPEFRAEPWYNPDGDCIVFQMANEAIVADRIDEILTLYRSAIDRRPIGFQIKGVHALIQKFGVDGLELESVTSDHEVKSISVTALLLAAYEEGPKTFNRRQAYAIAFEQPPKTGISVQELTPA